LVELQQTERLLLVASDEDNLLSAPPAIPGLLMAFVKGSGDEDGLGGTLIP
jgi:hypothetical protein